LAKLTSKKKPKKKRLSAAERRVQAAQRQHAASVRRVFTNSGFARFPKLTDRPFWLTEHIKSDFDDIFLYENLLICAEYTISNSDNVPTHLRKKKIVYDEIAERPESIISTLSSLDSDFKAEIKKNYNENEIIVRCIYCSRYDFDNKHKEISTNAEYLDYPELRYFKSLTESIKHSARAEIIDFLDVKLLDLGHEGKIETHTESKKFRATVLPEANSNFEPGFKVVSFYIDPETLLNQAYVLRRQGWRDSDSVYQRMISKVKISQIRRHLKLKQRVFVNNIIATLDDDTKILNEDGYTVDPAQIKKTTTVYLQIPNKLNTVGLIDGQHRTFAYYVSNPDDIEIARLRKRQNLLVTGIIYPKGKSDRDREAFEAGLFLEINSTQKNAPPDLKQAINRIVEPFSDVSIAASVVERLSKGSGPLNGQIVRHWFDTDKLRTTSIVSYGMKPLTKLSGTDSMFHLWQHPGKARLLDKEDSALLNEYISFCQQEVDKYLIALKKTLPTHLWTPDRKVEGRLLSTTFINSLLICLRMLIENGKTGESSYYETKFKGLTSKSFEGFHSSQYGKLADKIYKEYF
jgi:DGQHR domain-containing protein